MDVDGRIPVALCILGIMIAAGSFIAYVISPSNMTTYTFIAGMALIGIGYAMAFMNHHRTVSEYKEAAELEEESGLTVSLDDTYVPYDNPATITDLREE
jgi:putative Mn2+ efflux pump MntP